MKAWQYISYVVLAIAIVFIWEYKSQMNSTWRLMISSPSLMLDYFVSNSSSLLQATWVTFYESFVGLLIATTFSFSTMIVCFYIPRLMDFFLPIMIVSQVIPLITLAPLFIILFGVGAGAKIAMATLLCYFPIFVNFSNGVKLISNNIHELTFIYNISTIQKIRFVFFPLAMPSIMAGLKIAATLAVIGAIVAEFNGAQIGLGKNLFLAAKRLEPDLMMVSLILSSILGGSMYAFILFIEKQFGKWYITNN